MSIPVLQTCKMMRKRKTKVYNFHSFGDPGSAINPTGPFRDNIRAFLQECAEPEDYNVDGMPVWCTHLAIESKSTVLPLYTIEENANDSPNPFCDHCRCTGWGDNFVTRRRYHVIIPIDEEWNKRLEEGVFDVHTHILHGLIHCNGFGHLLCINGIEGGSKTLSGREIMDLWDRLCINLRARKISVEDVSKKRFMDLRLLYGVAYGHSWFGRWGYKFCRGSFGVTEHNYNSAIEILSSLALNKIIQDFSNTNEYKEMKQMIDYYRNLSETQLITFRDLLRFMLTIKSCPCAQKKLRLAADATASSSAPKSTARVAALQKKPLVKQKCTRYRKFSSLIGSLESRWPARRLEYTAGVIVDALKAKKKADKYSHGGMTRQDVRDAARMHIGDTGLLDYVLKSMNNVIIGGHVVRRAVNPKTKILEYSIDELGKENRSAGLTEIEAAVPEPLPAAPVPGADLYADLGYLYLKVLLNYPESELAELATQTILDSKHFVKVWPFKDEEDELLRFICQVMPNIIHLEVELKKELPPGEIVVLPLHSTVAELKQAAENALRDTYCIMENFEVTEINQMEELMDEELLFGSVESGAELFMRGNGMDLNTELRYESGPDNWKVRCQCGAEDDDGERMVACDICEVWQHTRCNGIEDSEAVPLLFVCTRCCDSMIKSRKKVKVEIGNSEDLLMIPAIFQDFANDGIGMLL
ncbi:PHD finger protein MALE MEIOCYTE DEATH 1 [Ricinus communis]|uniref:DNA binding protein, putative n=1 Tax=Ricinus communis TaxID=3988 RepID=B9T5F9_RICCO|nr:PHD finger protein MALE MEIOCYTE DEATH 1 [Ricinus communis]EEF28910.1 DNA binding protein, putative [Ricinus communis]|eukprot:XP_002533478.1 PHD finger protein MALE MEIOCYTE DEATH 1 [Ricinus communis]